MEVNQEAARGGVAMHLSGCKAREGSDARIMQYVCPGTCEDCENSKKIGWQVTLRSLQQWEKDSQGALAFPGAQKIPLFGGLHAHEVAQSSDAKHYRSQAHRLGAPHKEWEGNWFKWIAS